MKKLCYVSAIAFCLGSGLLISANAQNLQAIVTTSTTDSGVWNYTLTNSEPISGSSWLTDFFLPINAPITNVQTAKGWEINTDYANYIQWSNTEPEPFPNDIAPSESVSGFSFTSVSTGTPVQFVLSSWDHPSDAAGPTLKGTILAPDASSAVPEPSTITTFSIGALSLLLFAVRRRLKSTARSV